jgi:hypothetical protein
MSLITVIFNHNDKNRKPSFMLKLYFNFTWKCPSVI